MALGNNRTRNGYRQDLVRMIYIAREKWDWSDEALAKHYQVSLRKIRGYRCQIEKKDMRRIFADTRGELAMIQGRAFIRPGEVPRGQILVDPVIIVDADHTLDDVTRELIMQNVVIGDIGFQRWRKLDMDMPRGVFQDMARRAQAQIDRKGNRNDSE